jgi:hypothetical protein
MVICCTCLLPLLLGGSFGGPHSKVTQNDQLLMRLLQVLSSYGKSKSAAYLHSKKFLTILNVQIMPTSKVALTHVCVLLGLGKLSYKSM